MSKFGTIINQGDQGDQEFGTNPSTCRCTWRRRMHISFTKVAQGYDWNWVISESITCPGGGCLEGVINPGGWNHYGSGSANPTQTSMYHIGIDKCSTCSCSNPVSQYGSRSDNGKAVPFAQLPECVQNLVREPNSPPGPAAEAWHVKNQKCMEVILKDQGAFDPPSDNMMRRMCAGTGDVVIF